MERAQLIDLAYKAEKKYGLPKGMLVAQLHQESSDGTNTYNPEGPVGVMQIQPGTAKALGFDPNDPAQAIDGAGRIMQKNLSDAKGNVSQALKLYYAGSPQGIGPRSNAYPGQVASKWNPDDAFEAAMGGNTQPVETAPPQPASPDNSQPDYEGSFDKAMSGHSDTAPAPDEAPAEDPALVNLKAGMQHIAQLTHSPEKVREFVRDSGYDPSTMANIDANVKTGKLAFASDFDEKTKPLIHTTTNDLTAGFQRGTNDVTGTLNQFSSYMDQKLPFLASIDNAASSITGLPTAQGYQNLSDANILNRKAYDQNFGSFASGAGRLGGQVVMSAPAMAAAGTVAPEIEAGNLLTKGITAAGTGAGIGAASNALTASASDQSLGQRVAEGAEGGAILGPVASGATGAVSAIANRVAPGVDAATAQLVQLAKSKYGINLDADQITNSPLVRKVSAMMDLNPVNNHLERDALQRGQFTRAVGQTFGADSDTLTPEVMTAAKRKIGATMDAVATRNPIHVDDTLLGDLGDIESTYRGSLTDQEMAPVQRNLDNILNAAREGDTITGETYQRLTAKGSPLSTATNSANPNIRQAAIDIRGALDDALERSATAAGNDADIQALRTSRLQYKNMKTVEPLVSKSADGQITPALLNNRVSVNFKNRAYQGAGDLGELADIGNRFLNPPRTSGTPEGIRANRMLDHSSAATAVVGGLAGHYLLGIPAGPDIAMAALYGGRGVVNGGTNAILKRIFESQVYKNKLLGRALNTDAAASPNLLPVFANVSWNRLLQNTYLSPQPQSP